MVRFENGRLGHQDVGTGTIAGYPFPKQGTQAPFCPVAFDGVADLFPGDECHTGFRAFSEKEDEPGSMPDLVGTLVDPVELTLLREMGKAV